MNKLSRVYVANAGYRLAWYDGLLLNFTDVETDEPTHTIFNLVNQGGKTTFLSLLFSCIRTSRSDFLQTKSTPGQHFEDYFDRNGLPGIIALEWQLPGDLANKTRTVVTGQVVVLQRGSDPVQADRWFFLMQGNDHVTIEDIPGPNLRGGQAGLLKGRDDTLTWLHSQRTKHGEQVFYFTQNQGEWSRAMQSVGIDVELLSRQVDFNQKEGGMDDSFLSFRDEREFVRRFLSLTMEAERANSVAQLVGSQCAKLRTRKPLQEAQAQLEQFASEFRPFAEAARSYRDANREKQQTRHQIAEAVSTLLERAAEQTRLKDAKSAEGLALQAQAIADDVKNLAARRSVSAMTLEQLARAERVAKAALEDADKAVAGAIRRQKLVEAAELRGQMLTLTRELQELAAAIDRASGEIAPIRAHYRVMAALLQEGLRRARALALRQSQEAKGKETSARGELIQITSQAASLTLRRSTAQGLRVAAETNLGREQQSRRDLELAGALLHGEAGTAAVERLNERLAELYATREQLDTDATDADSRAAELQKHQPALVAKRTEASAEAKRLDEILSAGLALQERMKHSEVLCRAIGAELADPDSDVLTGLVEAYILKLQQDATQAELEHGRLDEDARSVRETRLAGRDPEVTKVVRALTNAGVKGVQAFPSYLAQVLPNEEMARRAFESDPARFQGVAVVSPEQLTEAHRHLGALPAVTRPVVISVATDKPASSFNDGRIVIGPADASQFNFDAAQRKGQQFEHLLQQSTQSRQTARSALLTGQQERQKLQEYLETYGAARLATLAATKAEKLALASDLEAQLRSLAEQVKTEQEKAKQARQQAKNMAPAITKAERERTQLQGYVTQYEAHVAEWRQTVDAKRAEEAELEAQLGQLDVRKTELEGILRDSSIAATRLADVAQSVFDELATVLDPDAEFDAAAALDDKHQTLGELRTACRTAKEALEAKELEQTAPLQAKRKIAEDRLTLVNERYAEVGTDLPLPEVDALIGEDLKLEKAKTKAAVDLAAEEKEVWAANHTEAKTRHTDFRKSRTDPGYFEPQLAELDDVKLTKRLEERQEEAIATAATAAAARTEAGKARAAAAEYAANVERFDSAAKGLKASAPEDFVVPASPVLFSNPRTAADEASALQMTLRQADAKLEKLHRKAHGLFGKVQACWRRPKSEPLLRVVPTQN